MRILIATGIFPPDIGGPAVHTKKLAETFSKRGWGIRVVTYTSGVEAMSLPFPVRRVPRSLPKLIKRAWYLFHILTGAVGADIIYAHDPTSAGYPASIVARLLKKKFMIRVGGDAIWEKVAGGGKRFISMEEYYKEKLHLRDHPKLFRLIKKVLLKASIVIVPAELLKELYADHYGIPRDRIWVIDNPVPPRKNTKKEKNPSNIVLFAGRFVAYKNLIFLIKAFDRVRQKTGRGELHLVGDGPDRKKIRTKIDSLQSKRYIKVFSTVSREELLKKIEIVALGVGPALTEFNPNFILECLAADKPVLISRENGLTVKLPEEFLFDAGSSAEFEEKLTDLLNEKKYGRAVDKIKSLDFKQTWENVLKTHAELFESLSKVK